jgi:hypothetical protein
VNLALVAYSFVPTIHCVFESVHQSGSQQIPKRRHIRTCRLAHPNLPIYNRNQVSLLTLFTNTQTQSEGKDVQL